MKKLRMNVGGYTSEGMSLEHEIKTKEDEKRNIKVKEEDGEVKTME